MFQVNKAREVIKVKDLKPHSKNPKLHDVKLISKSIENLGFIDDVVIDENNVILGGHGRIKALKELGQEEVEVIRISNWTEEQKEKYLLTANQSTMLGGIDNELLLDFDKDILDFSGFNSDILISEEAKDDDVPEIPKKPISKLGDLYELPTKDGQFHRVLCGDSTSKEDVEKLMGGKKANMAFTDPPYNIDYQGGMNSNGQNKRSKIKNDKMSKEDFKEFLDKSVKNIIDNTGGGIYVCMSSRYLGSLKEVFEENGGHWQSFIIWVKNHFTLGRIDYQSNYESILYGWSKDVVNHYFIDRRNIADVWEDLREVKTEKKDGKTIISFQGFKVEIDGDVESGRVIRKKQKVDIWRYNRPNKSEEHPTMKPVALVSEAIINSSKKGQIVLDTFLGSGSTLIASEKTDRICYGTELDPIYIDVIIQRYVEYTGNNKIIKNGKEIIWQK